MVVAWLGMVAVNSLIHILHLGSLLGLFNAWETDGKGLADTRVAAEQKQFPVFHLRTRSIRFLQCLFMISSLLLQKDLLFPITTLVFF